MTNEPHWLETPEQHTARQQLSKELFIQAQIRGRINEHHQRVIKWVSENLPPKVKSYEILSWQTNHTWTRVLVELTGFGRTTLEMGEHDPMGHMSWPPDEAGEGYQPAIPGAVTIETVEDRRKRVLQKLLEIKKLDPRDQAKMLIHYLDAEFDFSPEDIDDFLQAAKTVFTDPPVTMRGNLISMDIAGTPSRGFTPSLRIHIGGQSYRLDGESQPPNIVLVPDGR